MTRSEAGKLGAIASKEFNERRNKERIDNYYINPSLCAECGNPLEYKIRKNKFCGHSCSAKFNNKLKSAIKKCCYCLGNLHNTNSDFCSRKCHQNFMTLVRFCRGNVSSRSMKSYLTLMKGYKCSCCGIKDWNNKPIMFDIEHINGNADDNSLSNVCLMCPNCHSQTPTYKAKNKGNGRHYRRLRYKENKSF